MDLIYIYIQFIVHMESIERREPVILHQVPFLPQLQIKALIIKSLPQASLNTQDIILRRKEGKYQAFLMIPSEKVTEVCNIKELNIANEKVFVRKWFSNYQVFVGRLPESLSSEEVRAGIQSQFGNITKYEEVQPHEGSKNKFRHLYLQFQKDTDAEKCLFSDIKLIIKNFQLRVARPYAIGENEETDKKLFIKVTSPFDDSNELNSTVNAYFRTQGKLRQKIHLESGKGVIIFTSSDAADQALKNFRSNKIGKYEAILRPDANSKDNFTIFMAGINFKLTDSELQQALRQYEPIISCQLLPNNTKGSMNANVTFGSEQPFKRILAQYKFNKNLKAIFEGAPYITVHMNAKDRFEYNNFRKGAQNRKGPIMSRPLVGFNNVEQPFMMNHPSQFGFYPPKLPQMGMPMNFGMNPNMRIPLPVEQRQ